MNNLSAYIIGVDGEEKTGKTTFALTLPRPIADFTFDIGGFERAADRFEKEIEAGDIVNFDIALPIQGQGPAITALQNRVKPDAENIKIHQSGTVTGYIELWYDVFMPKYIEVLLDPRFKSVLFDPGTMLWTVCTQTMLQEKQLKDPSRIRLLEIEYAEPNARMTTLIHAAREQGKNLAFIHYLRDARRSQVAPDGSVESVVWGKEQAGWSHFRKSADLIIETWLKDKITGKLWSPSERVQVENEVKPDLIPQARITLDGLTLHTTGLNLKDPTWDKVTKAMDMIRNGASSEEPIGV